MSNSNLDKAIKHLGESINDILVQALTVEDVRASRTSSIDFEANEKGIYGKGLYWKGQEHTRQLVYRANPDRIFTSESIDIQAGQTYSIGNVPVITENSLGNGITHSNLVKVGTLKNLKTQGDLVVDDYVYFSASSQKLGIGTEDPNGNVSVASLESEFIIDVDGTKSRVGNYTTDDLELITDNTARIKVSSTGHITLGTNNETKVSVTGRLGIGINNPPSDASLSTAGPIRFEGKKFESGNEIPRSGSYAKGDIVWNSDPKPTGYVGWICVREGTPGVWKPFGQISQ